jgi:hypothetical protein
MKKIIVALLLIVGIVQANPYLQNVADTIYPFVERDSSTNYSLYQTVDTAAMSMQVYSPGTMTGTLGAGRFYPFKSSAGTFYGAYYYLAPIGEMNHNKIMFEAHSTTANKVFPDIISIAPFTSSIATVANQTNLAASVTGDSGASAKALAAAVQCSTDVKTILERVPAAVALAYNLAQDSIAITKIRDSVDAKTTTRMATFTYVAPVNQFDSTKWTAARANKIDSLNASIASRMATFTYTAPNNQFDSTKWTAAKAAFLDRKISLGTDTTIWTHLRANRIDNYISSRQPKTTSTIR